MTKIIGTKEAFTKMIYEKNVYQKLRVDKSTISNWKGALKGNGRYIPTIDKMEEMLLKYGAKVKSEKVWLVE